jgi:hypothetical protein
MSFLDLERIDANDSIIWVLWGSVVCVYIEKGGKCKISAKNSRVSRFTYCVNRFRQLNDKPDEQWSLILIRHKLNRFKTPQMKIDTIQTLMNQFNQIQRVSWYDSLKFESIQARRKWKMDVDNISIDSDFLWINLRKLWIDSLWIYSGKLWIDSLWYYSTKLWIDSLRYYSGKFYSIQNEWHKAYRVYKTCVLEIRKDSIA